MLVNMVMYMFMSVFKRVLVCMFMPLHVAVIVIVYF